MSDFFSFLYRMFESMFGSDLGQHLEGWDGTDFTGNSIYVSMGWILIGLTLLSVISFYYFINSPRFSRWFHWLLVLIVNAVFLFAISYFMVNGDFTDGVISADIAPLIEKSHIFFWGLANVLLSGIIFTIFSFFLRWWSTNCSTTPIPQ